MPDISMCKNKDCPSREAWCATSDPFSPEAPYDLEALDAALLMASDYEEKINFLAGHPHKLPESH